MSTRRISGGVTWVTRCYASGTDKEHGSRWATSAYPNQGVDWTVAPYETDAESRRSLEAKFGADTLTPMNHLVVDLIRMDQVGILAASDDGWGQCGDSWRPGDSRDQSA